MKRPVEALERPASVELTKKVREWVASTNRFMRLVCDLSLLNFAAAGGGLAGGGASPAVRRRVQVAGKGWVAPRRPSHRPPRMSTCMRRAHLVDGFI